MKIMHVIISGPFTVGMTYQENLLPIQNKNDRHEVLIVASCYEWDKEKITKIGECDTVIENGIRLIRIAYDWLLSEKVSEKIRKSSKLIPIVQKFKPDIIFLHDPQVFEIINLAKYKRSHMNVKFIVDCHSDMGNSARNIISYYILHKLFYKTILNIASDAIDKMYYVSDTSRVFLEKVYKYKNNNIEFYPLGGRVLEKSTTNTISIRKQLNILNDEIMMVHSGKFNRTKKTKEMLEVFNRKKNKIKLIIIGNIETQYQKEILPLINENVNISYIGWKTGEDLLKYLEASDIYIQPGSASATLQNAICAGNAIITANKEIYGNIVKNNGWIIDSVSQIEKIFDEICNNENIIKDMKKESLKVGKELLDYKTLAKRMYEA